MGHGFTRIYTDLLYCWFMFPENLFWSVSSWLVTAPPLGLHWLLLRCGVVKIWILRSNRRMTGFRVQGLISINEIITTRHMDQGSLVSNGYFTKTSDIRMVSSEIVGQFIDLLFNPFIFRYFCLQELDRYPGLLLQPLGGQEVNASHWKLFLRNGS